MKRNLMVVYVSIVLCLLILPVSAAEVVDSGFCTGSETLTWSLTDDGTLTISGEGEMPSVLTAKYPWYSHASSITKLVVTDGVTSIGKNAFYRKYTSLTEVELADSVSSIGSNAFLNTTALTSIKWPSGLSEIGEYAFQNSALTQAELPGNITTVGKHAFNGCKGLLTATLPDSLVSLGTHVFANCTALTTASVGKGVAELPQSTFYKCTSLNEVSLPDEMTSIGISAFERCSSLVTVQLPSSLTSIGESAFEDCSALESLEIPDGVTSIGDYAFYDASSLSKVLWPSTLTEIGAGAFSYSGLTDANLPDSVTSIGSAAFSRCESLLCVTLPVGVDSIEADLFSDCDALTTVHISGPVTEIPEKCFYRCAALCEITLPDVLASIGSKAFFQCKALPLIDFPDTLTTIGDYAFYECSSLAQADLPTSLTTLGKQAFVRCPLTEVVIPDSIELLGNAVFEGCAYLESATLPDSLTTIPDQLFYGCGITDIGTWPSELTAIGAYAFSDCPITEVVVPDSVTTIGIGAFDGCNLTTAILPDHITVIPDYLFCGCPLTDIVFPAAVTTIGAYSYASTAVKELVIPATVTALGDGAFSSCNYLTCISLPGNSCSIGERTFSGCESLTVITIPAEVTSVGKNAFSSCQVLHDVIVEGRDTTFGEEIFLDCWTEPILWGHAGSQVESYAAEEGYTFFPFGTGDYRYYGTTECGLKWKILLDGTLVLYGSGAMADYENSYYYPWELYRDSIVKIVIEDEVTALDDMIFNDYPSLQSFHAGAALEYIGKLSFLDCPQLETVTVSPDNEHFAVVDNVLYSADKSILHLYPAGLTASSFTVPEGVATIDEGAFYMCTNLTHVELPDGLMAIEQIAFRGCDNIVQLELPNSVSFVGSDALSNFPVKMKLTPLSEPLSTTSNLGDHQYCSISRFSDKIYSHLYENEDGSITRVEASYRYYSDGAVLGSRPELYVERYTRNGTQIRWESGFSVDVRLELPIYGGYYTDGEYHYLVFGDNNPDELGSKEVFRIVKYSKDWTLRLGSASLYGGTDTAAPFSAGTVRMAKYGDILYVATAHTMTNYNVSGSHQEGFFFTVNTSTMRPLQYQGNVSHSFNQFVGAKHDKVYVLHHGDATPRSVVLYEYPCNPGDADLFPGYGSRMESVNILFIAGSSGDNETGVMVGAVDYTGKTYLTAGTSVVQIYSQYDTSMAYNIFLASSIPGDSTADFNEVQWLTDYTEEDEFFAGNPYLTQVEEDKYLLFWPQCSGEDRYSVQETGTIFYVYVDAMGNLLGKIQKFSGYLSDCEPIAVDGGVMWYTTNGSAPTFYYLKGDALMTVNEDGSTSLQIHGDVCLVAAGYDENGRMTHIELEDFTTQTIAILPCFDAVDTRYYIVNKHNWLPLCLPFR